MAPDEESRLSKKSDLTPSNLQEFNWRAPYLDAHGGNGSLLNPVDAFDLFRQSDTPGSRHPGAGRTCPCHKEAARR
jgi:hypothetical protein